MIEYLLNLMGESPILFLIIVVNIVLISYIIISITLYILKRKQPDRVFSLLIWKLKAKRKKGEAKTIEDVYMLVMENLRKERIITDKDGTGFLARRKSLEKIPSPRKKILEKIFSLYEAKVYGNRRIANESKVASDLLFTYLNMQ